MLGELEPVQNNSTNFTDTDKSEDENDPCKGLTAIDLANVDDAGAFEYDTDVGDSCEKKHTFLYSIQNFIFSVEMKINPDPDKQRCEALKSASDTALLNLGPKLTETMSRLTELLLSKSVVGEEHVIDTKQIKILAKIASGEEATKPINILDTGVVIKLPDHFCLGNPEDGKCNSPVGFSTIVYKFNPQVNKLFHGLMYETN